MPEHDFDILAEFGLVAIGGDLEPRTLLRAYRGGVFPWYDGGEPIHWWSPDPRCVMELDEFQCSRRLARTIRSGKFQCSIDRAFTSVLEGCADRHEGSWLHPDMFEAYTRMHELGHAHSVEAWHNGALAGGVYGIAINGFFAGESMFYRVRDASKVALAFLVDHLRERGFRLFDLQLLNPHTASLGATLIPRSQYMVRLQNALASSATFGQDRA